MEEPHAIPLTSCSHFYQPTIIVGKKRTFYFPVSIVWGGSISRAMFYSHDRMEWIPIPEDNVVTGSKFALICTSFESCDFELDLAHYQVPIGKSKGQLLSNYICGHTTKGCGVLSEIPIVQSKRIVHISAIATIETAVFLR